jgi:adenylyltransferase/sulfurtransferase
MLSDEQVERYSRQIILSGVGGKQCRLLSAAVVVVAAGEAGHTAATYLAAGGVGELRLPAASPQAQETHRQIAELNPDCCVSLAPSPATGLPRCIVGTALALSDDLAGIRVLNETCVRHQVPLLVAWDDDRGTHVAMFAGHTDGMACWSCHGSEPEPSVRKRNLQPAAAAFAGTVMATEAMKSVLGIGTSLLGRKLTFDGHRSEVAVAPLEKNETCEVCSATRRTAAADQ